MEQYSKEAMDHFMNPRNVGEIKDPDAVGEVGNMRCGDIMHIYLKVGKRPLKSIKYQVSSIKETGHSVAGSINNEAIEQSNSDTEEYIEDIKFKTLGCAAAIASTSMMTELAKGKSLEEAKKITRDDINEALGILPKQKYHCSILSADGIQKAIDNYESKQKN